MGVKIVRFEYQNEKQWGVVEGDQVFVLKSTSSSLSDFLKEGVEEAREANNNPSAEKLALDQVNLLSPVTQPARIVCQGANYASHRAESGIDSNRPPYNMFFRKADSSLSGARDEIVRPEHVKLLDYELELGLVIGKEITGPVSITDENLHEYVAGLVIANDVSARDIQLLQMQWYKGKSYRTFCPVGPYLYLLDQEELPLIHNLNLNLWVNGELRQSANTEQLLYKPAETLAELSEVMDLSPGDLLITGTTGGVALRLNKEVIGVIENHGMPFDEKMNAFLKSQQENPYLQDGDVVRCKIKSPDGQINLGIQENRVTAALTGVLK